jgi:hypothetical protein
MQLWSSERKLRRQTGLPVLSVFIVDWHVITVYWVENLIGFSDWYHDSAVVQQVNGLGVGYMIDY